MKEEYNFSQSVRNSYVKNLKKQITICLEEDMIEYLKTLAEEIGVPYQTLIILYLVIQIIILDFLCM